MCAACSTGIPLCSIDTVCGQTLLQQIRIILFAFLSVFTGISLWLVHLITKRNELKRLAKITKLNHKDDKDSKDQIAN